jgi:predicted esterase
MRNLAFLLATSLLLALPAPGETYATGKVVDGITCASDPTQTYALFLPSRYTPGTPWPVLFVFDPRSRGAVAAELFRPAAETYGWIVVSSNNTMSDGEWAPNAKAVQAMWPDVHKRFAVDAKRTYAAGFSGGAMVGWMLGQQTKQLAGLISCGGRVADPGRIDAVDFAWYGTAGDVDFNFPESKTTDAGLEKRGLPHRLTVFPGPHRWASPELLQEAVEWMELQAMRAGTRARDAALVEKLYAADAAAAAKLAADHADAAAMRRWAAIARTYADLRDTAAAKKEAERLAATREVKNALKEEQYWDAYEQKYLQRLAKVKVELLQQSMPPIAAELERAIDLSGIQKRSQGTSYEATTARRLVESAFSYLSFYFFRELSLAHRYAAAAAALQVASQIRETPALRYNLACSYALSGDRKRALDALEAAVKLGYDDRKAIGADPDLVSLHGEARYREILAKTK